MHLLILLILFLFYSTEAKLSQHCKGKKLADLQAYFPDFYFQDAATDQRVQHWRWQ